MATVLAILTLSTAAYPNIFYDSVSGGESSIFESYFYDDCFDCPADGLTTYFNAPLDSSGFDPTASWPVSGVAAPTVYWYGDDPTGSLGSSSHTFTQTGSTTEVTTPFCYSGSSCMKARRFDGASTYYTSDSNGIADCNSGDCSVVAIARYDPDTAGVSYNLVAQSRINGVDQGWALSVTDNRTAAAFGVENSATTTSSAVYNNREIDGWILLVGTHDYDGNVKAYHGIDPDGTSASPGGTISTPGMPLWIGARADVDKFFDGDIAAVFWWDSLLSAADIDAIYDHFFGLVDEEGAEPTFSNTGPVCAWVNGVIECYGDDAPILGAEVAPGLTGAGNPDSGFFSMASLTNSLPYSRDLSTGWIELGASVVSTSTVSWFADARQQYKTTDDAAGTNEGIYQLVSKSGAASIATLVCAATETGTGIVTLISKEKTGGSCGEPYSYDTLTTTTTVTCKCIARTFTDPNCSDVTISLYPSDVIGVGVSDTGHASLVAQSFLDQDWCPPVSYIETAASAVTAGADILSYDPSNFLNGSGEFEDETYHISLDWAPALDDVKNGSVYLTHLNDGTINQRSIFYWTQTTDLLSWYTIPPGATDMQSASAVTLTPGTALSLEWIGNYDTDAYEIKVDGGSEDTSSTARATPTGMNTLSIAHGLGGDLQMPGGAFISNVKVEY